MTVSWWIKTALLVLVAVPAFTGFPLDHWAQEPVAGLTWGWVGYFGLANLTVAATSGVRRYADIITAAALISLPVVWVGAVISYFVWLCGWGAADGQAAFSRHYLRLLVTMLTVIPLAIGLVSALPVEQIERGVLTRTGGVGRRHRYLLMAIRVFNHIVFCVIPASLEVIREERSFDFKTHRWSHRSRMLIAVMTQLGVQTICMSVRYVPLWAVEISRLPHPKNTR